MTKTNKGIINYGTIGGDASVKNRKVQYGDNISTVATNSTVNVDSVLERASQKIEGAKALDEPVREELYELISRLTDALNRLPSETGHNGIAVATEAEKLVAVVADSKPNRTAVEQVCESLLRAAKAAKAVADATSPILDITKGIISIATSLIV